MDDDWNTIIFQVLFTEAEAKAMLAASQCRSEDVMILATFHLNNAAAARAENSVPASAFIEAVVHTLGKAQCHSSVAQLAAQAATLAVLVGLRWRVHSASMRSASSDAQCVKLMKDRCQSPRQHATVVSMKSEPLVFEHTLIRRPYTRNKRQSRREYAVLPCGFVCYAAVANMSFSLLA